MEGRVFDAAARLERARKAKQRSENAAQMELTTTGSSHPATSHKAAERAAPYSLSVRQRILDALRQSSGGMTRSELIAHLHVNPNTLRPRVRELIEQGKIRQGVEERANDDGNDEKILFATED